MINSFKNPAIMRILRTTERHGAGWREQNFIPDDEVLRWWNQGKNKASKSNTAENCDQIATVEEKIDFSNVKIEPIFEEMVDFDTIS